MAGRLAVDFDNEYTVAAWWRQGLDRAGTLYIPGVTRPALNRYIGKGARLFLAPSVISYGTGEDEACLIGQEVMDEADGLGSTRQVFDHLQFDVITGKKVYSLVGDRRLNRQEIAQQYLAMFLTRAGQALGLASQAVITFTMPVEACLSDSIWQKYQRWLEDAVRQAGFSRLELVEEPWAAAWGAGMPVRPEIVYMVSKINTDSILAAIVQVVPHSRERARYIRIISARQDWLDCQEDVAPDIILANNLRQTLRGAARLGYADSSLAGVVVTGSQVKPDMLAVIHKHFPAIPVYDKHSIDAAACGAAILASDAGGCGCLRYSYGLRYLAGNYYQYRELVTKGSFYPSVESITEFTIKASYDGQREFGLFIYRLEDGHCINDSKPVILSMEEPVDSGQSAITVAVSLDSAGQLVVTAVEAATSRVVADQLPVVKLV